MGRGGHELGVRDGGRMNFRGDEPGGMRDIGHEDGTARPRNLFEASKIERPGVGTPTDHNHSRFVLQGQPLHLCEVNLLRLRMHAVVDDAEEATGEVHRAPMGQMPPMRQIKPHDGVPRLEDRKVDRHIGLGTGVGLDIDMRGTEQRLGPLDGQGLSLIHELTAAIISPTRIPLGVLVGHNGACRLQHRLAHEVLRGDEFQSVGLPLRLSVNGLGDLRVHLAQWLYHVLLSISCWQARTLERLHAPSSRSSSTLSSQRTSLLAFKRSSGR